MRILAPIGLVIFVGGFLKVWPPQPQVPQVISYEEYMHGFTDQSKTQRIEGKLFVLNELETREITEFLGGTDWSGGPNWGHVSFDAGGRTAAYANEKGRASGHILIQGPLPGTVPALAGEWQQTDGQSGRLLVMIPINRKVLHVSWGPGFKIDSTWTRLHRQP